MSSRKLQAGTSRGDDVRARETRRCFTGETAEVEAPEGKGALKEKVEEEGGFAVESVARDMVV